MAPSRIFTPARKWSVFVADDALHGSNKFIAPVGNPATTALGTIDPRGREKGLQAGANVLMPNLSPTAVREKYALYDNKICTGEESAQCLACLEARVASVGFKIVTDRGDSKIQ